MAPETEAQSATPSSPLLQMSYETAAQSLQPTAGAAGPLGGSAGTSYLADQPALAA